MEAGFWHEKWEKNEIGFHEGQVNRMLAAFHNKLPAGGRVFVPLCGKTRDIAWLLSKGFRVAGAELSELAIQQLFDELEVTPQVSAEGPLKRYAAEGLDIFTGDIFDLEAETLEPVDAVFDRAALVALPEGVRGKYAAHVAEITGQPPQLVITFEYDPAVMDGPPFTQTDDEIKGYYAARYSPTLLADENVAGGLKGFCPAREKAWLMTPI